MTFVRSMRLPDLGVGAGYALWGFRAAAVHHGDCPALVEAFQQTFGEEGSEALFALHVLARILGRDGGRRIALAAPGCCRVTADELSIVAALAAAQEKAEARRDAHLSWLMGGRAEERARGAADLVAASFARASLKIDAPGVEVSAAPAPRALRIRHAAGAA